jgi:DNA repair protein RecN (Recombination protein N)
MLEQLYVENMAVIKSVSIPFSNGLTVLTGETGAGKSLIVDAINFILGSRSSREMIRDGASRMIVSAAFSDLSNTERMEAGVLGIEPDEEGRILLERSLSSDGRSMSQVNGKPVTIAALRELGKSLVNVYWQNENLFLLAQDNHIDILDSFAELEDALLSYQNSYEICKKIQRKLRRNKANAEEKAQRLETLDYQINEISSAQLQQGEDADMVEKIAIFSNIDRIRSSLSGAYRLLLNESTSNHPSVLPMLDAAIDEMARSSKISDETMQFYSRIQAVQEELKVLASEMQAFLDRLEFDEEQQNIIQERWSLISALKKKYGKTISDILAFLQTVTAEREAILLTSQSMEELEKQLSSEMIALKEKSRILSDRRREAAEKFSNLVTEQLLSLDMQNILFSVEISKTREYAPKGQDSVSFMISTNPGEPLKPMSKIASGGELSRIMLSIQNILSEIWGVGTLIFDEVDSGVSGRTAHQIALKLQKISAKRQVICVTHLAQMAAAADSHYLVVKDSQDGHTCTNVSVLSEDRRVEEIARIMGGLTITQLNIRNAEEMLSNSKRK